MCIPEVSRLLGGASGDQQLLGTAMSIMTCQQARELQEVEASQRAQEQEASAQATPPYVEEDESLGMRVVSVR